MSDHYSEAWQFPAIIHQSPATFFDKFIAGRNIGKNVLATMRWQQRVGNNSNVVVVLPEIARQTDTFTIGCLLG